jgi:hypothetical protein
LRDDLFQKGLIKPLEIRKEKVGITFELSEVLAARRRFALSFRSTGIDISVRYSTALTDALRNASAMVVGWIPF